MLGFISTLSRYKCTCCTFHDVCVYRLYMLPSFGPISVSIYGCFDSESIRNMD